ncbi:arylsulfatase A-like enzyme [Rhodopirellula rubra]|uniref:Arylsulfatase A-like enzyme n=1 Tax=Aporhodopirellula rubra TaxID=980271 RepID=A0A7W5E2Q3_9BACT|nr:sulfatase-like hydrolase/transferase [Aporhodopirellula rubra]MBB3209040.1 arylsulfatase A-like enzyme [Aporhodopirellula rubra]
MNHPLFLAHLLCVLILMGTGNLSGQSLNSDSTDDERTQPPNIILIMADDVSWECFGCYGAEDYQTPHIDSLANRGIRFNHCYSTPICTPSRVKIMTGQYSFRNYTHFGYLNPQDKTFGNLLQSAGYETAVAGKWQLNGLYHKAEGCTDSTRPHQTGFDEYCLWQLTKEKNAVGGGERFWSPPLESNGQFLSSQDNANQYGPDIMSDFVCDFIKRDRDKPFFVYYPTVLVHSPFVPTPDTIGDQTRDHSANKAPKNKPAQKANFVAMVNYLDKIVGKIVRTVEEAGQLDNTLILFTADNGTNRGIASQWNGQRIQGGKGGTKDMGTHVPMVAYWKGHTPVGSVCDDLVDFTDFYATFAEAAALTLGEDDPIDGRSVLPQINGDKGNPRDWVLCHYQPYWGSVTGAQYVRDQQFKLYRDGTFYLVPNDLKELNDLAKGEAGERGETARGQLKSVLQIAPPAPPAKGGKNAKLRPIHPDWPVITNGNE